MGLEKDVTELQKVFEFAKDVFKPADEKELKARGAGRLVKLEKAKADYLQSPNHCPFCDSEDISAGKEFPESGTLYQEVDCNNCNETWTEVYKLVTILPD